jgi:uncharacterized membrane protein
MGNSAIGRSLQSWTHPGQMVGHMTTDAVLVILFRWLHVATACVAVGGVFFVRIILPAGLAVLPSDSAKAAFLRTRAIFKRVIHTCIFLLLISGTYNAVRNWPAYTAMGPGIGHGLFGIHLLLALVVFGIALWLLAGKEPPVNHRKWAAVNLTLLLLAVAAASTLKYAREHAAKSPAPVSPR